mgnify:CR=1 FL=1
MEQVKKKPSYQYKRDTVTCDKCNCKVIVESDFLSDSAMKSLHKCKGGKSAKGK